MVKISKKNIWNLNEDYKKRDLIIFGEEINWRIQVGKAKRFSIKLFQFKELIFNNFIKMDMNQNESPIFASFFEFMNKYPQIKAVGIAISPEREDYRVSIDGLEGNEQISLELISEFKKRFGDANEFRANEKEVWCWYE